jgi:hypothetical protein
MILLSALLLTTTIDGAAAHQHASALSALGPHPFGSPRTGAAALYVAAQFREAGLEAVRTVGVESGGLRGSNVYGSLEAAGAGLVVLAAHHDSSPGSPGGWDSGGSLGVLIEVARVLAKQPHRPRALLFASFDGGAVGGGGRSGAVGARAWAAGLSGEAKRIEAVLVLGGAGWPGGRPILHTSTYREVSVGGGRVVAPSGAVAAALDGIGRLGVEPVLGDPLVPWLYQPTSRLIEMDFGGADRALLQAGLPAVLLSEASVAFPFPRRNQPADTADRLDDESLARMGRALLGAIAGIGRGQTAAGSLEWLFGAGRMLGPTELALVAALTLVPVLVSAVRAGGLALVLRGVHAAIFSFAVLRMPVLAVVLLGPANLMAVFGRVRWRALGLLPLLACLTYAALAARQGVVRGVLPGLLEISLLLACLALALAPALGGGGRRRPGRNGGQPGGKEAGRKRRKGLAKR